MGIYDIFVHSHSLFFALALISFILVVVFHNKGKAKPAKILHMVLRLLYILLIVTGVAMIIMNPYWATVVKGLLAIWLIFTMEMIGTRMGKGTLTGSMKTSMWIQFTVALIAVFIFGYGVTG